MPKIILLLAVLLFNLFATAQSTVTLRRSFIDSFMNKVTIDVTYDVWFTHHKAKNAKDDGDIHFSGYSNQIGMPTVAEIMNAKDEREVIDIIIDHEGKGKANNPKIDMTGVWRLWPEHMGAGETFVQGMRLSKAAIQKKTTNPDHVFEIHPVTKLEGVDLLHSLINIEGYTPKIARKAFSDFRKKKFTISSKKKTISFATTQVGNNYIDMWIRIDSLWEVEDGAFAYCTVLDSDFDEANDDVDEKTVSNKVRVAFVKDSEVCKTALQTNIGGFMHILGTPRINLAIVSWREWVSKDRPEVLTWRLPVEIIASALIE